MRFLLGLALLGLVLSGCAAKSEGDGQTKADFTPKGGVPEGFKNSAPKGPSSSATPPGAQGG